MDLKLLESVKRIISSGYNKYPHIKFRVFDEGSKIVNPVEGKFFIKGSDNFNSKFAFAIKLEKVLILFILKYSTYMVKSIYNKGLYTRSVLNVLAINKGPSICNRICC